MAARPGKETGVHAIVGDAKAGFDSYRAEEALEGLLEAALGRDRGHALETLRGDETTWGRVLDAARTPSLFASRVAVVVRGAESIKGDSAEVEAYLEDPNPGTLLVLIAAKPDGRKAVWKRILGKAQVVKAVPLKGRELRAFVEAELRRRRLSLEPEASEALLERVGQDLRRLMGEVDKLEAFAAGEPRLGVETVAAVLGHGLAQPLYRLGDALLHRRAGQVLALAEEMLDEGEAAPLVLATLYRSLRQLRGVHALGGRRARQADLASRLRIPPFKVGEVVAAAERWPDGDLRRALTAFGRADRDLKRGVDPRVALSAAVVEACRPGGERGQA